MPWLPLRLSLALAACLAVAGCGSERLELDPLAVSGKKVKVDYRDVGMRFDAAAELLISRRQRPEVFRGSLAEAFVAAWVYRRREEVPRTRSQLRTARKRLVKTVEKRDKDFKLRDARRTRVSRAPAIEVIGDQSVSGGRLRTRSVHIFKRKAEYVVEMAAPRGIYRRVNRTAFDPLVRSLKVTGKLKPAKRKQAQKKDREKGDKGRRRGADKGGRKGADRP